MLHGKTEQMTEDTDVRRGRHFHDSWEVLRASRVLCLDT